MTLGDGIRRNIAHVDPTERAALRDALLELNRRFFPGTRTDPVTSGDCSTGGVNLTGHVSWWFKQDEIHQATHVHHGTEFLPWHRESCNRLEELLRQINPLLSLHYWDWKQDPRAIPNANLGVGVPPGTLNLFTPDFMGYGGAVSAPIGQPWQNDVAPWRSDGFYVPGASPDRNSSCNPADPPAAVNRSVVGSPLAPDRETNVMGTGILDQADYATMRDDSHLEGAHDDMHGFVRMGGQHISFRDPFVFLLHSNVDRLFARWQTDPAHPERLVGSTVYGSESGDPGLNSNVEPWSTGHSVAFGQPHFTRPWYAPESQGVPHTYKDPSVVAPPCYDTNLSTFRINEVENPFNAATNRFQLIFNDVPEEETAWRAAVIRVYTCPDTTFRVKPGTEPPMGSPFGIEVGQATAVHGAHPHGYQEVRIWFRYTAGAVGTAGPTGHDDGPLNTTIKCDQTTDEFLFELRAHYIQRPTVAVQMALDQSGSMAWAAGTSGLSRLQVLKDAAKLFVSVIQRNNGIGIIRFDQDAYQPNHATFGTVPFSQVPDDDPNNMVRTNARTAIDAHGAHGETSVGDGLIMARNQLTPLSSVTYQNKAILLLTDGIENSPVTIATAIGSGAVDDRVYAIGLGNEFQVNTAALTSVAGAGGGKLLLSGVLAAGTDDFFRVKKFFLQILAGVTKTSIVRDPSGYINVGNVVRIPFQLCEADINCRVILLTDFPVVRLSVETPDGQKIDEGNAGGFGVTFATADNTKTASFNLPLPFQANRIQSGSWTAILEIDEELYKKYLSGGFEKNPNRSFISDLRSKGAKYCLSVHSFSNLRMTSTVSQTTFTPGSTMSIRAILTEYNQPVERRANVNAETEYPDHTKTVLPLAETQPGVFETSLTANQAGIYRFNVVAEGGTYKGVPFSREELLTAATLNEIHQPPVQDGSGKDGDTVVGAFERCCRRMGIFVWFIILLLLIIIIVLLLRL
jgi:hypothetical protein